MPTNVFRCEACRHEFSVETAWSRKHEVTCPQCQAASLREMFGRYSLSVVAAGSAHASANGSSSGAGCGCGNPAGG